MAVVSPSGLLLGLLCLKRSFTGFCTDDGVARMRRERGSGPPTLNDRFLRPHQRALLSGCQELKMTGNGVRPFRRDQPPTDQSQEPQ
jgi:hypothetical protein